jgi:ribosome recycling factor
MADPDLGDLQKRMDQTLEVLKKEFAGLRTGRASIHLLDPITVEAYGQQMPLNQVGSISVPEPRMISVQVWDRSMVSAVDKAIRDAGLGVNPVVAGQLIRIPIPPLSSERRTELTKVAHKYAEHARVAIRNVRRDGNDMLKKMEKDGDLSEDEHRLWADEIQEMTDRHIKIIDEQLAQKDAEILQV